MSTSTTASPPSALSTPSTTPKSAVIGLLLVQVFFASFPVAGKLAFMGFEPMAVAIWRVVIAALVFSAVALRMHGSEFWAGGKDLALLFVLSMLGVTLNQVLFIRGLHLSSATNAGLLMPVIPVAIYGFALVLKREPFRWRRMIGLILATSGILALLVSQGRGGNFGSDSMIGDLMMVGNACCYGLYVVLAKPLLARRPAMVVMAWVFLFGALTVPFFDLGADLAPSAADQSAWLSLAWIVIFPTLVAYFLNLWALRSIDASIVGIFICLQPLISISSAVILLGEPFGWPILLCGLMVLAGVILVSWRRRKPQIA